MLFHILVVLSLEILCLLPDWQEIKPLMGKVRGIFDYTESFLLKSVLRNGPQRED